MIANYWNKLFITIFIVMLLSACVKKGEVTTYKDRFNGSSRTKLELGVINTPPPAPTVGYEYGDKKEEHIRESGEFTGNAALVKNEKEQYFLYIIQPSCPGGKLGNSVIFLINGHKLNSSLYKDSRKIEIVHPPVHTAYGTVPGNYICNEEAVIGPLAKDFFVELIKTNSVEFKIYNSNYDTMSRLNKTEIDLINSFVH